MAVGDFKGASCDDDVCLCCLTFELSRHRRWDALASKRKMGRRPGACCQARHAVGGRLERRVRQHLPRRAWRCVARDAQTPVFELDYGRRFELAARPALVFQPPRFWHEAATAARPAAVRGTDALKDLSVARRCCHTLEVVTALARRLWIWLVPVQGRDGKTPADLDISVQADEAAPSNGCCLECGEDQHVRPVLPNVRAKLATTAWRAGRAAQNGAKPQRLMASVTCRWRSA